MDSPLIYMLFSVLMLVLTFVGLTLWGQGAISCAELLGTAVLMLLCFSLFSVPGAFPWNLLLLLAPVGYAAIHGLHRRMSHRLTREMRAQDYERCRRLIAQDPRNAAAHAMLATMLEEDGRPQEALEEYREAMRYDASDHAMLQRHNRLAERVGLAESGQIKCLACLTIQPAEAGLCWKCGRVFHGQRALVTRFKRLGFRGRLAAVLCAAALSCAVSASIATMGGADERLVPLLVIPGLLLALACAGWLGWMYWQLLEREAREREP